MKLKVVVHPRAKAERIEQELLGGLYVHVTGPRYNLLMGVFSGEKFEEKNSIGMCPFAMLILQTAELMANAYPESAGKIGVYVHPRRFCGWFVEQEDNLSLTGGHRGKVKRPVAACTLMVELGRFLQEKEGERNNLLPDKIRPPATIIDIRGKEAKVTSREEEREQAKKELDKQLRELEKITGTNEVRRQIKAAENCDISPRSEEAGTFSIR